MSEIKLHEHAVIQFANQELWLLPEICIFWPSPKTLIVADLHLEKGSYLAAHGNLIPAYDTQDTLIRLQKIIDRYKPDRVICLGDNVHDAEAFSRMVMANVALLDSLYQSVPQWLWIKGNHEKLHALKKEANNIELNDYIKIKNIYFSHELLEGIDFQIIGHYHPKLVIHKKGIRVKGKCFVVRPNMIILPSFGSYTGGLNVKCANKDEIFNHAQYYLIYNEQVLLMENF